MYIYNEQGELIGVDRKITDEEELKRTIHELRLERNADFFVNVLGLSIKLAIDIVVFASPFAIYDCTHKAVAEVPEYERMRAYVSSDGEVQVTTQYTDFENPQSLFTYYSEWQPVDEEYCRIVETYTVDVSKDISGLFDKDTDKIKNMLGDKVSSTKEVKSDLNEEEIEKGSYYEAVLYLNNFDKTLERKPTEEELKAQQLEKVVFIGASEVAVGAIYISLRKLGVLESIYWDFDYGINYAIADYKKDLKELKKSKRKGR